MEVALMIVIKDLLFFLVSSAALQKGKIELWHFLVLLVS